MAPFPNFFSASHECEFTKQVGLTFLISLYFTGLLPLLSNADSYVSFGKFYFLLAVVIIVFALFFLFFAFFFDFRFNLL